MKKIQIVCIAVLLAALSGYSAPLTVNFESDKPGGAPKADKVSPKTAAAAADNLITVIDAAANKAGTGQGISIVDNTTNTGTSLEYSFADTASQVSTLMVSMNFACINKSSESKSYIVVGLGASNAKLTAATARWNEVRLYGDSTLKVAVDGSVTGQKSRSFDGGGSPNKLVMVVNDTAEPITYELDGPQTLKEDSVDYWLNGKLAASVSLDKEVVGTDKNYGRIGLSTSSGTIGVDFVFDDITVTPLP
jgi:hypothetical protein